MRVLSMFAKGNRRAIPDNVSGDGVRWLPGGKPSKPNKNLLSIGGMGNGADGDFHSMAAELGVAFVY